MIISHINCYINQKRNHYLICDHSIKLSKKITLIDILLKQDSGFQDKKALQKIQQLRKAEISDGVL